jgi:hypothetical protein
MGTQIGIAQMSAKGSRERATIIGELQQQSGDLGAVVNTLGQIECIFGTLQNVSSNPQRRTFPSRRCKIRNVGQFPPRRCISDVRLFPPRSCNVRPFPPGRHRDASSREEAPLP